MRDQSGFDSLLRNNHTRVLLYVFVLALVLRLVYLFEYARSPFFWVPAMDSLYNDNQAMAIAHGHVSHAVYWRAPLYAYFLAALYLLFGHSLIAARVAGELLGCASCSLTYALGVRAMRPAAALVAAVGMVFYGPMIFNDGELQSLALEVFLDLGMLIAAADGLQTGRARSWAMAGLLLGVSAIVRPTILLALPLILLAQWRAGARLVSAGSIFVACAMVAPVCATARNAIVAHDPVFIASQGGINLYVGNHDGADGFTPTTPTHYDYDGAYRDAIELYGQRAAEQALRRPLKASQVNGYWTGQAVRWWRLHPVTALKLALKKFVLMWTKSEIRDNVAFDYIRREWAPVLWLTGIGFWLAGPLGLAGMAGFTLAIGARRNNREQPAQSAIPFLLCAYVLVTMTSFVLFFAAERFRLPVVPALLLLAGSGFVAFADALTALELRSLTTIGIAFILGCLLVNVPWYKTQSRAVQALDYWSCGNRYESLKRYPQAIAQYRIAASIDPSNPDIWLNLGDAYYYSGDALGALRVWRTANAIAPSASGYYNLGTCEEMLGKHDAARRDLREAHRLRGY
jgi:tetratricopeptide (TPR) repeat protein